MVGRNGLSTGKECSRDHEGTSKGAHVVTVKTLENSFKFELLPTEDAKELKSRLIREKLKDGATGKKIRLIYMGRVIKDTEIPVAVVKRDSVVHCVMSDQNPLDSPVATSVDVERPLSDIIPVDWESLLEQDRELALRMSRLETGIDSSSQESTSSDEELSRRDRVFERIQARIQRQRLRNDESARNAYQNFVFGFVLGFCFGVFMLLYVKLYNSRTRKEMNIGIVCGVCANALYTISKNSGLLDEEDVERKYYEEENAMFQAAEIRAGGPS
mmetsp:Transcript_6909/g.8354  ORF Transcript_6909/g.8354 Transcript_6909/m.8354 type:complete len:272 (+) Transcript_6909:447-1262(+)